MRHPLPPVANSKPVIITAAISVFFALYKFVDALGNADFLLQKLGLSEGVAKFLGSTRTIDAMIALSFIGLVISLVYQLNRLMVVAESTPKQEALHGAIEPPLIASALVRDAQSEGETPDRVIVNVAPEYLTGFFKEHTEAQANKLVSAYIGKWIKISGFVGDVGLSESFATVYMELPQCIAVYLQFNGKKLMNRVEVIRRGEEIHAIGQIDRVSAATFRLKNCELLDPASAE
jgi:predicted thioredoxin/glutaredoxin